MNSKYSAHINVMAYSRTGYAGTVRVQQDTRHLKMVDGRKLPIIEVNKSPQRFAVFVEPHHNKRH